MKYMIYFFGESPWVSLNSHFISKRSLRSLKYKFAKSKSKTSKGTENEFGSELEKFMRLHRLRDDVVK